MSRELAATGLRRMGVLLNRAEENGDEEEPMELAALASGSCILAAKRGGLLPLSLAA